MVKDKIKILHILTQINDGGLEILVYRIFKGLDKNKYELNLCTLKKSVDGFIVQGFRNVANNYIELNFENKKPGFKGTLKNINNFFKLAKIIRKGNYDIVHSHEIFSPFFTRLAIIFNRLLFFKKPNKVFVTYHNVYYWLKPIHFKINKFLAFFTDKIICVSASVMEDSYKNEKIKKDKYFVIYNGIEISDFYHNIDLRKNKRKELGYSENDFVIGNVGVLSERKGQIYLVRAFNLLREKYDGLKLLLVGSKREFELDYYYELMNLIEKSKFKNDIKVIGTTKEINSLYNVFDVFVMSSVTEGFGLAVYEAMLVNKLCVFSDIPTFKELIKEGETGMFFKSKDEFSLFKVLENVINNFDNYKEIANNGREFTKENFDIEKMISQYDNLYNIYNN